MEDIVVTEHITIPAAELEVAIARSAGPGGQNVNKVNSKVSIQWALRESQVVSELVKHRLIALAGSRHTLAGTILVTSQEHRDQPSNMRSCQDKLRRLLLEALKPVKARKPTKPSRASQRRRIEDKRQNSRRKSLRRGGDMDG